MKKKKRKSAEEVRDDDVDDPDELSGVMQEDDWDWV